MNKEFQEIFTRLRAIIASHAGRLDVSADTATHYCLHLRFSPKLKKGFPVAWVKIEKNYVSYHFMPVYMFPTLREGLSEKLRARMQGKACFNFKKVDEALFGELDDLTANGLAISRQSGFAP